MTLSLNIAARLTLLSSLLFSVSANALYSQAPAPQMAPETRSAAPEISQVQAPTPLTSFNPGQIEAYNIKFYPWGNRDVIFRDQMGRPLGEILDGQFLQLRVDPETHDASIKDNGIDVETLLKNIGTITTPAGVTVPVRLSQTITLANGTVLLEGTQVYADLNDFMVYKSVQPYSSTGGRPEENQRFYETLADKGVTPKTRPTVEPRRHAPTNTPLDPKIQQRAEEQAAVSRGQTAAQGRSTDLGNLPTRFLSSPICDCNKRGRLGCGFNDRENFGATRWRWDSKRRKMIRKSNAHEGQDFQTGTGTMVSNAAYGCVDEVGVEGGYGRTIVIRHANGLKTRYAHLQSSSVRVGRCYARGAVIGRSGESGSPGQPHLHFEVIVNGVPKNPRNYMAESTRQDYNRTCSAQIPLVQQRYAAIDSILKGTPEGQSNERGIPVARRTVR